MYATSTTEVEEMTNKQYFDQLKNIAMNYAVNFELGQEAIMNFLPNDEQIALRKMLKAAQEARKKIRSSEKEN
jgi:hypothetical protein